MARESSASVSSVMKFCATQPACEAAMPSFKRESLAPVRKVRTWSAVGADDGLGGPPGALTFEQLALSRASSTSVDGSPGHRERLVLMRSLYR